MSRKSDLYYKAERLEKELEAEKIISSDLLRKAAELQSQLKEAKKEIHKLSDFAHSFEVAVDSQTEVIEDLQSQLKAERENTKELMIQFDLWLGSDHRSISEATVNEFLTSNPK